MRPLTHLYAANLILDEITKGGKLSIPPIDGKYTNGPLAEPYTDAEALLTVSQKAAAEAAPKPLVFPVKGRTFQMPPKAMKAITENKEYFRGGAAGFGAMPDAVFNKTIIRRSDSGIWLEYMYGRMLALAAGKMRDQVYAFILGTMAHYAAEIFWSAYVNEYAPGWKGEAAEQRIAVERYIDTKISDAVAKDDRKISVPAEFLTSCFSDIDRIEEKMKSTVKYTAITQKEKPKENETEKAVTGGEEATSKGSVAKDKEAEMAVGKTAKSTEESKTEKAEDKTAKSAEESKSEKADDKTAKPSEESKTEKTESINIETADTGREKRSEKYLSQYRAGYMLIRNMSKIRDTVRGFVRYDTKKETSIDNVLHTSADRFGLIMGWADDIDKAIKEWITAWEGVVQDSLNGEGTEAVKKNIGKWYDDNWKNITGAVDWLDSVQELDATIKGEIQEIFHSVRELQESSTIKELDAGSGKEPFERLFPEHYSSIYKEYETGKNTDKEINTAFKQKYEKASDLYKLLDNDMRDFGKDPYPYGDAKKEFRAFSLGLTASKLGIMGHKNLYHYLHRDELKVKDPEALSAVRRLRVKIVVKSDDIKEPEPGICIPAKFDIVAVDKTELRVLIRRRSNPQEKSPAEEESVIVLQRPMPYDQIKEFRISKFGLDDWSIESLEVIDTDTGWTIASKKNFILPDEKAVSLSFKKTAVKFKEEKMEVPHEMMSWRYSLEGAEPAGSDPPVIKPWEYKEYAIYYDIFYPKSDPEKKTETEKKAFAVEKTEPEKEAESENKAEPEKETKPEKKTEPEKEAESEKKTEPEKEAEPEKKATSKKKAESETEKDEVKK